MATKAEIISQFGGYGNLKPERLDEHYFSSGFTRAETGLLAGRRLYQFYTANTTKFPQSGYSSVNSIRHIVDGFGRALDSASGSQSHIFSIDSGGVVYQSMNGVFTPEIVYDIGKSSTYYTQTTGGCIVDQKNRFLYAGSRYLGRFDPSIADVSASLTFTNGSATVTAGSSFFDSGDAGKLIRVQISGTSVYHYYRIQTYTSATQVSIYGTFSGTSGAKTVFVLRSWDDKFRDFGADIGATSEGGTSTVPTETYEDTVLFGRKNKITTLNTLTDSITTDASPAFTLPSGFDCVAIHKGSNGLLIASNFQRRGVLVLWDNFSDRSIAPWINLNNRIVSVAKYNGGWIVITSKEILYTNGYSVTPLISKFLDTQSAVYSSPSATIQTSVVVDNDLYCLLGVTYGGRRRNGLYKIDLTTKLAEYIPRHDYDMYNERSLCLYYGNGNGFGRLYTGSYNSWDYVIDNSNDMKAVTFISNPVGKGENIKYAEALKVNLGMSQTFWSPNQTFSFKITCKIWNMKEQLWNYGQLKTAMTEYNKITANETYLFDVPVGSEIQFWSGGNAGLSRNVISKTGNATDTAVYTLDRALPALDSTSDLYFVTPFKLVNTKVYTDILEVPTEIWFDIKNRIEGKHFMVKIDIEDATAPLILKEMLFVYSDLGIY